MMNTVRLEVSVPLSLRKALANASQERGISESRLVTLAITRMLKLGSQEEAGTQNASQLITRRLERQARQLEHLKQDTELLTETLAAFIRLYIGNTKEPTNKQKKDTEGAQQLRYRGLLNDISSRIVKGKFFVDELQANTFEDKEGFINEYGKAVNKEKIAV